MSFSTPMATSPFTPDSVFARLAEENPSLNSTVAELSRILSHNSAGTNQDGGSEELFRQIRCQIEALRQNYILQLHLHRERHQNVTSLDLLRSAFASPTTQYDPVLHYLLRQLIFPEKEVPQAMKNKALGVMARRHDNYVTVLGNLLPADLRSASEKAAKNLRYQHDAQLASDDWPIFLDRARAWGQEYSLGITTGLEPLDQALGGGLKGLTFLGGPPGVGKTALALSIAAAALAKDMDLVVVFLSLDMPKEQLYMRLLSWQTGIAFSELVRSSLDVPDIGARSDELRTSVLSRLRMITTVPEEGFAADWIERLIRETFKQIKNARRALIVIDHFQLLGVGGEGVSECEVDKALMDVIDQVQVSTRYADNPYGDPFLVLSQTRKDAGDSGLEVADLLGSADLGYRASNVLMLEPAERTARHNDFTPLALRILKGRDGVTRTTIPLEFHHRVTQFKTLGETAQSKKATNTAVTLNPYGGTR